MYKLTMTEDYVSEWGQWEAVRELLQNSIDQSRSEGSEMILKQPEGGLIVGTTNSKLEPKTLLLGMSTKGAGDLGQFGEGYKLAMLVLVREGVSVKVYNDDVIWTPRLELDPDYGVRMLVIDECPNPPEPTGNVVFELRGLDDGILANKYLPDAPTIIPGGAGRVYVEGLYVCQVAGFEDGYNFGSKVLRLGRDRMMVSTFDLQWQTGLLYAQRDDLYDKLEDDAPEVKYVDTTITRARSEAVLDVFEAKHPDAIPVSTQAEIEAAGSGKWVLVPTVLKNILHRVKDWCLKEPETVCSMLESFKAEHGQELSAEGLEALDVIIGRAINES
jgi:hypothetical protein